MRLSRRFWEYSQMIQFVQTFGVVRAILLHFWLAYDHPFEDGNGRTARALFYWCMRARGYWLVEYLSISRILAKAPAKYTRAFLLTETDGEDTTYFIVYQLEVIERAVRELHTYMRRKVKEVRDVERLLKGSSDFNHRQLALLGNAIRTSDASYSFQSHAASHSVTHETAEMTSCLLLSGGCWSSVEWVGATSLRLHQGCRNFSKKPAAEASELGGRTTRIERVAAAATDRAGSGRCDRSR